MPRVIRRRAVSAEQRVVSLARELAAISPLAVLDRGYSVTLGPDGRAVRTPQDVTAGDAIVTRLADGSLRSVVGAGDGGQRAVRRKPRPSSEPASGLPGDGVPQMDLFDSGG
jgi:exodeoxyribonuclease VII large subunit